MHVGALEEHDTPLRREHIEETAPTKCDKNQQVVKVIQASESDLSFRETQEGKEEGDQDTKTVKNNVAESSNEILSQKGMIIFTSITNPCCEWFSLNDS